MNDARKMLDNQAHGPRRVLLVDDCKVTQKLLARILQKDGVEVEIAEDGHQALGLLAQRGFDLVLLDQFLPRMDGIATTEQIRSLCHPNASVMILGISGDDPKEYIGRWYQAGIDGFLLKPIVPRILKLAVESVAGSRKSPLYETSRSQCFQESLSALCQGAEELLRSMNCQEGKQPINFLGTINPQARHSSTPSVLELTEQIQRLADDDKLDEARQVAENLKSIASDCLATLNRSRVQSHDQSPSRR